MSRFKGRHAPIKLLQKLVFSMSALSMLTLSGTATAQVTGFMQSIAEAAAEDRDIAAFYRANGYEDIFTGADDAARRIALYRAFAKAGDHGLPTQRYHPDALRAAFEGASSQRARGAAEVAAARMFLDYARDLNTGVLEPGKIVDGIKRQVPRHDPVDLLTAFAAAEPVAYLAGLAPDGHEYVRLQREMLRLQQVIARDGWGRGVPGSSKLEPGDSGDRVIALRDRLVRMGYLARTPDRNYGNALRAAVQQFQIDHGLLADGVTGPSTLEQINTSAQQRLRSVLVAMERERWMNGPRGDRHVLVNITDFHARIIDDGKETFRTRSVVGARNLDKRTPEFSDTMEHMVINPTWNVPRSIVARDYLPNFKRNPNANSYLKLIDASGRVVPRDTIDFSEMTERNFPFDVKQPPGRRNALGLVKFMFPNRHNIYLHDTPDKHLFKRERRTYSSGCIRLNDPFDFAYAVLARQTNDPKALFHSILDSGRETTVELEQHIPVHLIYRTAFTVAKGNVQYRADIYGRDARLFDALQAAGVAMPALQG